MGTFDAISLEASFYEIVFSRVSVKASTLELKLDRSNIDLEDKHRIDVYVELMKENSNWCRHHEQQRSNACSLIFVMAAAIISIVEITDYKESNLHLGIFIIVIGIFGIMFVYKHYERFVTHLAYSREYRDEIDRISPLNIEKIRENSRVRRQKMFLFYNLFKKTRLHYYWAILMLIVVLSGLHISLG